MPIVTAAAPSNVRPALASNITIFGANFGIMPLTVTASVGDSLCSSAQWISDSAVRCAPPPAVPGGPQSISLGAGGGDLVGSVQGVISFDAPVLTSVEPSSGNMRGGVSRIALLAKSSEPSFVWSDCMEVCLLYSLSSCQDVISLRGSNFGGVDATLSVLVGASACASQSWISDTSITCTLPPASSAGYAKLTTSVQNTFLSIF